MCRVRRRRTARAESSAAIPHTSTSIGEVETVYNDGVNLATDLDDALRTNLSPQRVIEDASASEDRFLARYGDTQLLLVKLQAGAEALEMGLSRRRSAARSRACSRAFA